MVLQGLPLPLQERQGQQLEQQELQEQQLEQQKLEQQQQELDRQRSSLAPVNRSSPHPVSSRRKSEGRQRGAWSQARGKGMVTRTTYRCGKRKKTQHHQKRYNPHPSASWKHFHFAESGITKKRVKNRQPPGPNSPQDSLPGRWQSRKDEWVGSQFRRGGIGVWGQGCRC